MPIYEYECEGCHAVFEVRQKISDPAPDSHSCGSKNVRRILSATTFVLKGTGWYKTDYADKKPQGDGERKEASESKDGKSDGGAKESKSDKGEAKSKSDAPSKSDGPKASAPSSKGASKAQ